MHVIVAIAYGKRVILKVPYEKMTGEFFATFIREHFNLTFAKATDKTISSMNRRITAILASRARE